MYNKLFTKILDSSIWLAPTPTRIVWITLLAAMDEDGYAHFSAVENLAARARVTVEEAEEAVKCFTSPDHNSGNPDNDGRRVERVPGGFFILNAAHHRDMMNRTVQREQTRLRVAKHRAAKKAGKSCNTLPMLPSDTPVYENENASECTSGKGDARGKGRWKTPTPEEISLHAAKIGLPAIEAEKFLNYYESNGWKVGRAPGNPMKSWTHALQNWKVNYDERRTQNGGSGARRLTVAEERNSHITGADETRKQLREVEAINKAESDAGYVPFDP